MRTITALAALAVIQIVVITYFCCDKYRKEKYDSVQPEEYQFSEDPTWDTVLMARKGATKINVIKLE